MKDQHRAMFTALRGGELDAMLERAVGLSDAPPPVSRVPSPKSVRPPRVSPSVPPRESERPRRRSLSNPSLRGVAQSVPPPTAESFDLEMGTLEPLPTRSRPPGPRKSRPPQPRPQPQRPQLASAPEARARSIFGEEAISEQTLDEVILSYLAEDLDGTQK